ncbi:MAG: hypothetical protein GY757_19180 [bacterium]|nr:hypothetical protein [bacterium]
MKPKEGQKIFCVKTPRDSRNIVKIYTVPVEKVGRLYFYASPGYGQVKFRIDTWIEKSEVYTANWKAYTNEEAYKAEQHNKTLKYDIKNRVDTHHTFMGKKFSTEDLEKILEILKGGADA